MSNDDEHIVEIKGKILEGLKKIFPPSLPPSPSGFGGGGMMQLVVRIEGEQPPFKVVLFAKKHLAKKHQEPRVRIEKDGESVVYKIKDGKRVTKSKTLKLYDSQVQKYLQNHKDELIAKWEEHLPSG